MSSAVSRDRRDDFELLKRAVTLAGPRVNQREVGDLSRTPCESLAIGMSSTARRASRIASSFRPSPASSIATLVEVLFILGLVAPCRVHLLARGCKHRQRLLLIAARKRNLSVSPISGGCPPKASSANFAGVAAITLFAAS